MEKQEQDPLADLVAYLDQCAADGIKPVVQDNDLTTWSKGALIAHIMKLEQQISDIYHNQQ